MKSRFTFLAVITAMLTVPTMAQAEIYSTLAARKSAEDGWAIGYALGYRTPNESIQEALAECSKYGLGQCTPLFTRAGHACVAIAEGDDGAAGWGGGENVTLADAKASAMRKCSRFGDNCRVTASDCTGNNPVADSGLIESNDPLLGRWEARREIDSEVNIETHSRSLDINKKLGNEKYSGTAYYSGTAHFRVSHSLSGKVKDACDVLYRVSISLLSNSNVNIHATRKSNTCDDSMGDNYSRRFYLYGRVLTEDNDSPIRYAKVN